MFLFVAVDNALFQTRSNLSCYSSSVVVNKRPLASLSYVVFVPFVGVNFIDLDVDIFYLVFN